MSESKTPTDRPAPIDGGGGEGFWEGIRAGELRVQQCDGCGLLRHYPQPLCPECHDRRFHWEPSRVAARSIRIASPIAPSIPRGRITCPT